MTTMTNSIVVKENNRRFEVIVDSNCDADKVHVDCSRHDDVSKRCDYAIRVSPQNPRHFFFVELKGNDVFYAARQLELTIKNEKPMYDAYPDRQAWVISGGWKPAIQTKWQVMKARMQREHRFKLLHKTKSHSIDLTNA